MYEAMHSIECISCHLLICYFGMWGSNRPAFLFGLIQADDLELDGLEPEDRVEREG